MMLGVFLACIAAIQAPAVSAVARSDIQEIRHGTEQSRELNRLVRRSIFAHADRIMRRRMDNLEIL